MRSAPPIVPGVPTANSSPASERWNASCTTEERSTPAPAQKRFASASKRLVRKSRPSETATPGYPSSATSRLLPRPITTHGTSVCSHASTRRVSARTEPACT